MGESSLPGPDLIYKTMEKVHIIRNLLQTTYRWKKSYAYHRRRELEFEEGDKVYINISPMKGVVRFFKKGKLLVMWIPMKSYKGLERLLMI